MSPEHINDILTLCEASAADNGFRELPNKTTLSLYLAKAGVGLTVAQIEAINIKGSTIQARTTKGDLYVVALEDVFGANIEGRMQAKTPRKAGFGS
jgi:hypothetical protein